MPASSLNSVPSSRSFAFTGTTFAGCLGFIPVVVGLGGFCVLGEGVCTVTDFCELVPPALYVGAPAEAPYSFKFFNNDSRVCTSLN